MKAILFGSIGSVVETSELQREAFNAAFADAGLDWHWSRQEYPELLRASGGQRRIEDVARARGETVDAAAVHARKSEIFHDTLAQAAKTPRPGVVQVLRAAREAGFGTGFVTMTESRTVEIIATALQDQFGTDFDVMTWRGVVDFAKPDPAVYRHALSELGLSPDEAIAVEDNKDGVLSARGAGLTTVAVPGKNTLPGDLAAAQIHVEGDDLFAAVFSTRPTEKAAS